MKIGEQRKPEGENSFPLRLHSRTSATSWSLLVFSKGAKECIYARICFWH